MHYVGTATGCSPFNKSVCRTRKSHNGLWHSDFPGNYRQSFLPRYRQSRHPPFPQCLHGPQLRPGLRPHHPNRKRSGRRGAAHSCGPATVLSPEPLEADGAACEPWDDAGVQIAALVCAPGNKSRRTNPPGSRSHTRTNRADRLHCRAGREPPLRSPHHLCQCRIVVNS